MSQAQGPEFANRDPRALAEKISLEDRIEQAIAWMGRGAVTGDKTSESEESPFVSDGTFNDNPALLGGYGR